MKTSKNIFNRKAFAFLGAAAFMFAAVFIAGCKTEVSSSDPVPETFALTFKPGEHGSVDAKAGGKAVATGAKLEKGTTVEFTATPESGYEVDKWTVTGGELVEGTGAEGSTTAKVKVNGDVTVSVTFTHVYEPVSFSDLSNYLQNTASSTDVNKIEVQGLTAADLKGDAWDDASPLGKILKANSDKKVALKFGGKIDGLTDMSYCFYGCTSLTQASAIPTGVTNMAGCFKGCTSLTQAPAIPTGVTYMSYCFNGCTSLTQAPAIPSGVTRMWDCFSGCTKLESAVLKCEYRAGNFGSAFNGCTSLPAGGIKVPAAQLGTYRTNASEMGVPADRFAAE